MPITLKSVFHNARGLRAGWRLAIFLAMVGTPALFLRFLSRAVGPASGSSPSNPPIPPRLFPLVGGFSELILFLAIFFFSWVMSRIEHRSVGEYGLPLNKKVFSRFFTGCVFWGFLPLTVLLVIMRLLGVFYFGHLSLHGKDIFVWGLAWAFMFLMVGFFEEYSFRGYVLHTLAEGIGFWPAAFVMALGFAWVHMSNGGETTVGIIATAVFAMFGAAILRRTGDLWLAVGAHAAWDWGQTYFFGVPDSGLPSNGHLLNPSIKPPDWLSGGTVGPEGSVLTLILWAVLFVLFLVIYRPKEEQPGAIAMESTSKPVLQFPTAPQS